MCEAKDFRRFLCIIVVGFSVVQQYPPRTRRSLLDFFSSLSLSFFVAEFLTSGRVPHGVGVALPGAFGWQVSVAAGFALAGRTSSSRSGRSVF